MVFRLGKHGFSLIELLAVLAVIAILVAIAIPALQSTGGAAKFTGTLEQIKGMLDEARTYAQAQNTYVWVAFYPADPGDRSGDELFVVTLSSSDGTNPFSSWSGAYPIPYTVPGTATTVQPAQKIAVLRQLRLNTTNFFTSAQIPALPATSTDAAPASQLVFTLAAPGTAFTLGRQPLPAGAEAPACSVIAFGPAGTAAAGPNLAAVIGLDFQPMKTINVADGHNLAELQISGVTGAVQVFRN